MTLKITSALIFGVSLAMHVAAAEPLKPGAVVRDCAECPEMAVVPAGSFIMGSSDAETAREQPPADVAAMEKPSHLVTIAKPFAVGRFEITRGQYAVFVKATQHADGPWCFVWNEPETKWEKKTGVSWHNPGFEQTDNDPVVCVSWDDSTAYVQWLATRTGKQYRLLSEAEWEYAARGGVANTRPWDASDATLAASRALGCAFGNVSDLTRAEVQPNVRNADPQGVFPCHDGVVFTAPVGRFTPNGFGLYDMIGNVWEWTADCENENYLGAPIDGSAWLTGECKNRSNRGGSWADPMWRTRSALREWDPAYGRYVINGIRVARDE